MKYIKQQKFEGCFNLETNFKLPFDFYLPDYNICIEYDGEQHFKSIKYFGGEKTLNRIIKTDFFKTKYCIDNNIKLIRIKYTENVEQILSQQLLNVIS